MSRYIVRFTVGLRLCEHAHDLMHAVSTTYGLGDNPDAAAERAMDRAQEGGRL